MSGMVWGGGMKRHWMTIIGVALLAAACSEANRQNSPVTLDVLPEQLLRRFDLSPTATGCAVNLATVSVKAVAVGNPTTNLPADNRFNDVQVSSYTVQYVRRDGGTLVPPPFTRAIALRVPLGSTVTLTPIVLVDTSLNQAPFAALTPSGGGRDPETGKTVVTMDVIVTVTGDTLAGERVAGSTRFTMDFCYACGGCI
jgi:hypothetical protein